MPLVPFLSRAVWGVALLCLAACSSPGAPVTPVASSPVVFKLATVGDSRGQPNAPGNTAQDNRWLQSTAVWARMLHEMEGQKPNALVFNGDMIHGYGTDKAGLDRQYAFWRGMVAGLMERGTYVLPVPGNHEVQDILRQPGGGTVKQATALREDAWRANMGDLILNQPLWQRLTGQPATAWAVDHAPAIGTDGITTRQDQLSYAFDAGTVHIAVVNTDPVGADDSVPLQWLGRDLAEAKARGATRFFVFGHKMAYTYVPPGKPARHEGLESREALRDAFWALIERYGATYFSGHQHVFHAWQPTRAQGGKAWQVIVGTAGSPLSIRPEDAASPADRMFVWAEVSVHQNGRVAMTVRGFEDLQSPTRVVLEQDL